MAQKIINTSQYKVLTSQLLNPLTVKIGDAQTEQKLNKTAQFVPFLAQDSSGYYVMTDILEPNSIRSASKKFTLENGKTIYRVDFWLGSTLYQNNIDNDEICNNDVCNDNEKTHLINVNNNVIASLNEFTMGVTKRLKHIMHIPQIQEKKSININIDVIKLGNQHMYRNIIEYDGTKNNISQKSLVDVIKHCSYKALIKIDGLCVTNTTAYLKIRLVRLYPMSIDTLDPVAKDGFLRELNVRTVDNVEKYSILTSIATSERLTKNEAKKKIMSIIKCSNKLHTS
jgi:hypothetical protein